MNNDASIIASDNSSKEGIRARFLRAGTLPNLTKGDLVWVKWFPGWTEARLIRKVPGNVWIARTNASYQGYNKCTVMVSNFGGKVAE